MLRFVIFLLSVSVALQAWQNIQTRRELHVWVPRLVEADARITDILQAMTE